MIDADDRADSQSETSAVGYPLDYWLSTKRIILFYSIGLTLTLTLTLYSPNP